MEQQTKYGIVGIVVLLLLTATGLSMFWLSDVSRGGETAVYIVSFQRHSLSGLRKDGEVTMKGIKVGSIKRIKIEAEELPDVYVTIEVDADTPVMKDTRATIERNLLTGSATINLVGGSRQSERLTDAPNGMGYPVIAEGPSGLQAVTESLPGLVSELKIAIENLNSVLSRENSQRLQKTLANIEQISITMSKNDETFAELLKNVNNLVVESTDLVAKFDRRTDMFETSFEESTKLLLLKLSNISREFQQTARAISRAAEGIEEPEAMFSSPAEENLGPGEKIKQ